MLRPVRQRTSTDLSLMLPPLQTGWTNIEPRSEQIWTWHKIHVGSFFRILEKRIEEYYLFPSPLPCFNVYGMVVLGTITSVITFLSVCRHPHLKNFLQKKNVRHWQQKATPKTSIEILCGESRFRPSSPRTRTKRTRLFSPILFLFFVR